MNNKKNKIIIIVVIVILVILGIILIPLFVNEKYGNNMKVNDLKLYVPSSWGKNKSNENIYNPKDESCYVAAGTIATTLQERKEYIETLYNNVKYTNKTINDIEWIIAYAEIADNTDSYEAYYYLHERNDVLYNIIFAINNKSKECNDYLPRLEKTLIFED